jgi:hypothetical protein
MCALLVLLNVYLCLKLTRIVASLFKEIIFLLLIVVVILCK